MPCGQASEPACTCRRISVPVHSTTSKATNVLEQGHQRNKPRHPAFLPALCNNCGRFLLHGITISSLTTKLNTITTTCSVSPMPLEHGYGREGPDAPLVAPPVISDMQSEFPCYLSTCLVERVYMQERSSNGAYGRSWSWEAQPLCAALLDFVCQTPSDNWNV